MNSIRKLLFGSDIMISIIAVICVYAILQIKFDFAFWIGRSNDADAINEIITNLSYSYLAGFVFYLLTVSLPHLRMKAKVKDALEIKIRKMRSNYKACIESVVPFPKKIAEKPTRDDVTALFKGVSYMSPCRLSATGLHMSIAHYIYRKHQENVVLTTQILEYKPWLTPENMSQIEEIRGSSLPKILDSITQPELKDLMDNEGSRITLAETVYELWQLADEITV